MVYVHSHLSSSTRGNANIDSNTCTDRNGDANPASGHDS